MADEPPPWSNPGFGEPTQIGEREWELPPWHTQWGRLVYPLMLVDQHANLFPLGTSFSFSTLDHIFTARHSIEGGLCQYHPRKDIFIQGGLEAAQRAGGLRGIQLAIISQGPNPMRGDITFDVRPLNSIHVAQPTDLVVGDIIADDSSLIPRISPRISFAPPRIGETVSCVGYCDSIVPDGGLSVAALGLRKINPYEELCHRLMIIEGKVQAFFIDGLSPSFVNGPCFTIDAEVPHGLSGGPVFNSNGSICGAVYSGATTFFDRPTTACALLYPLFLLRISFGFSMAGGRFKMTATQRSVAELVATQAIRTDRAEEEQLHFTFDEDGFLVGAAFHEADDGLIFQDFSAYQEGRPMVPVKDERMRAFKPNLDHPLVRKRRTVGGHL